jgi:hypothetical protein
MKTLFVISTLLAILGGQSFAGELPHPNLLIILTDDMGYADLKAFGDSEIPTPHLDRLAAEGTKFTSAYTAARTMSGLEMI